MRKLISTAAAQDYNGDRILKDQSCGGTCIRKRRSAGDVIICPYYQCKPGTSVEWCDLDHEQRRLRRDDEAERESFLG